MTNADFDFARDATADLRDAFRGVPREVLLPAGAKLVRFTTPGRNLVVESPWWVPEDVFAQLTKTAHRTGAPLIDVARSRLAVTQDWNPTMDSLCAVRLLRPARAWRGVVAHQPVAGRARDVLLMGGFEQAFVPGLSGTDFSMLYYVQMG